MGVFTKKRVSTPADPLESLRKEAENKVTRLEAEGAKVPKPKSERKTILDIAMDTITRPQSAYFTGAKRYTEAVNQGDLPKPNQFTPLGGLSSALFSKPFWGGVKEGLTGQTKTSGADLIKADFPEFAAKNPRATGILGAGTEILGDPLNLLGSAAPKLMGNLITKGAMAAVSATPETALAIEKLAPLMRQAPGIAQGATKLESGLRNLGRAFQRGSGNTAFAEDLRQFRAGKDTERQGIYAEIKDILKPLSPEQQRTVRRVLDVPGGQMPADALAAITTPKVQKFSVKSGQLTSPETLQRVGLKRPTPSQFDPAVANAVQQSKERVLDWVPQEYAKQGIPLNVIDEGYFPRVKQQEGALERLGGLFKRRPVRTSDPFAQARKIERDLPIEEINQKMGREFFREDLGVPLATRKIAAMENIEGRKFLKDIFGKYGMDADTLAKQAAEASGDTAALASVTSGPNIKTGMKVMALDRNNIGRVIGYDEGQDLVTVTFKNPETGATATKTFKSAELLPSKGSAYRGKRTRANLPEGYMWVSPDTGAIIKNQDAAKVGAVALPGEIASTIDGLSAAYRDPDGALKGIETASQQLRRIWGGLVTVWRPGFHANNYVGGIINNALAGVRDFRRYVQSFNILRGKSGTLVTDAGQKISYDTLRDKLRRTGTKDSGFAGAFDAGFTNEVAQEFGQGAKITRNPMDWYSGKMKKLGAAVENHLRSTLFIDRVAKGESFDQAARSVIDFHFDYSLEGLDPVGRKLKPWVPFYVWLRNNLELQLTQMTKQPMTYVNYERLRRGAAGDPTGRPDYLKDAIPLGSVGGQDLYWNLRTPIEDVKELVENPGRLASSIDPRAKVPADVYYNQNSFTGAPISRFTGDKKPMLGADVPAGLAYSLRGLSGIFGTGEQVISESMEDGFGPRQAAKLASQFIPGISAVDPSKQAMNEMYARNEELSDALRALAQKLDRQVITIPELKKQGRIPGKKKGIFGGK